MEVLLLTQHRGAGNRVLSPPACPTPQELVSAEEEFSAITDKIPQRPVGVVEGTSYTVIILAALGVSWLAGFLGTVRWQAACCGVSKTALLGAGCPTTSPMPPSSRRQCCMPL